jgi:hypothetical protein
MWRAVDEQRDGIAIIVDIAGRVEGGNAFVAAVPSLLDGEVGGGGWDAEEL